MKRYVALAEDEPNLEIDTFLNLARSIVYQRMRKTKRLRFDARTIS